MINVKVNDWVSRVPYPVMKKGFTQTYDNVCSSMKYRVVNIDEENESITIAILINDNYVQETFWAGNFRKIISKSILDERNDGKKISIVMGSNSDMDIMKSASDLLNEFSLEHEIRVVSAHRTPELMFDYAKTAKDKGIKVIIAGAGGAAHLPGMIASLTCIPVIGVPIKSSNSLDGWDSILSILQMPNGVPVATVALNGAYNAGLLAAEMLAISDDKLFEKLIVYKEKMKQNISRDMRDG